MEEDESKYVRIGDHVLFMSEEEQEDGYLASGGYVIIIISYICL
jgi:hypothetical protein